MSNLQPHIRCTTEDAAKYAILPGDPQRVDRMKPYLENVTEIAFNREHKSISGYYKGIKVMAVSTGMGGASTGIAVEELHNIGVENMIRIGSCGALQKNIHLGDLLLINGAVRDDGASKAYVESIYPAVPDTELLVCLMEAATEQEFPYHVGRCRSHDSFYTDREDEIDAYWSQKGILGADMETSALFTIGGLRGVRTGSILNTVSLFEGNLEDEINGYVNGENEAADGERKEILTALEAIVKMEQKENR
ncbi:MAG: nucleoside phosphorylase [Lachnospiraceae bacterium]|nr:nucleoside phosphorylase [Lachnospiraceae bacterium]